MMSKDGEPPSGSEFTANVDLLAPMESMYNVDLTVPTESIDDVLNNLVEIINEQSIASTIITQDTKYNEL